LQIRQLAAEAAPVRVESHPANPEGEGGYVTTSLAFDTRRALLSAFLVAWTVDVPPQVDQNEGQWLIEGAEFAAVLSIGSEGWSVHEPRSGVRRSFPLLPPIG
jgi:hypothetical protein